MYYRTYVTYMIWYMHINIIRIGYNVQYCVISLSLYLYMYIYICMYLLHNYMGRVPVCPCARRAVRRPISLYGIWARTDVYLCISQWFGHFWHGILMWLLLLCCWCGIGCVSQFLESEGFRQIASTMRWWTDCRSHSIWIETLQQSRKNYPHSHGEWWGHTLW